jgi:hypothetical protein
MISLLSANMAEMINSNECDEVVYEGEILAYSDTISGANPFFRGQQVGDKRSVELGVSGAGFGG